ncbi:hypothetical protein B9479_007051 [Cryptococcus floricola]|uniref:Uncharacterized protein n=1 Tax=Cryptococcus floricola TaxID=2591691 RepID=A0A5D3ALG1_9TREE|nr:hypothetical protein B9479_007051 [Cryptococcus floricola]
MRPSQVFRASHYKPMIKFLGPRKNLQHPPHKPSPHACAPPEILKSFPSFLAQLNTSPSPSSPSSAPASSKQDTRVKPSGKPVDFENFWEAPGYLWRTKEVGELEMDAVMVSFIRSSPWLHNWTGLAGDEAIGEGDGRLSDLEADWSVGDRRICASNRA